MSTSTMPSARRALLSVSDKTNLAEFAKGLTDLGFEIISTGGTAKHLKEHGIAVTQVSDVTKFPEIMEGRVKTLHPAIHGGLLADLDEKGHREALAAHAIAPIELVAINLYPFEAAAADSSLSRRAVIENIDVGGPAMIRAAAKNHAHVAVITDPADYALVLTELRNGGEKGLPRQLREDLAAKAFARTAAYDAAIAAWFFADSDKTPPYFAFSGTLVQELRYGENPHQSAALYRRPGAVGPTLIGAQKVQGKELSYNNMTDAEAAFELISEFQSGVPAVAIIKHANPCGTAMGTSLLEAYQKALACDPVSAFGGIVALNQTLDEPTATAILGLFTEVVIAPDATQEARRAFGKKPNVRLLLTGGLLDTEARPVSFRSISGGVLVQSADVDHESGGAFKVVTQRQPTEREKADLIFAMHVAKHVKSNAIVFAKDGATAGVGAGQMSRLDSVRIAVLKAREAAAAAGRDPDGTLLGSAMASDAFFPFADALLAGADAGATAVIQPGGSMRDEEVIKAANERDLAMVFTGVRHFRH